MYSSPRSEFCSDALKGALTASQQEAAIAAETIALLKESLSDSNRMFNRAMGRLNAALDVCEISMAAFNSEMQAAESRGTKTSKAIYDAVMAIGTKLKECK